MIKFFCDNCELECDNECVGMRVAMDKIQLSTNGPLLAVEIHLGVNGVRPGGHLCLSCAKMVVARAFQKFEEAI